MFESPRDTRPQLSAAETGAPEEDPAGPIMLSGQNRVCARARVLAGMLLTTGIVVAIGASDTTSSMGPNNPGSQATSISQQHVG